MSLRRKATILAAASVVAAACGDAIAPSPPPDAGPVDAAIDRDAATVSRYDVEEVKCERLDASVNDVPAPYGGRKSPLIASDPRVLDAGGATYRARCTLCHGAGGKGDGPEGPADPRPADFTLQRRPDDYLFWRISLGGRDAPFCSAMPSFVYMPELARWELVAFVQSLAPEVDAGDAAP
ncbi:MAG: c-type cytochrome [Deltaproteobacteria bacterium]|nr:c-type cytochrome [Deltaproteobacteria bacterium]